MHREQYDSISQAMRAFPFQEMQFNSPANQAVNNAIYKHTDRYMFADNNKYTGLFEFYARASFEDDVLAFLSGKIQNSGTIPAKLYRQTETPASTDRHENLHT
jgi:hypothetical protein